MSDPKKKGQANAKADDLRGKSTGELGSELESLYREGFNLRMQRGSGQDVKPHDFRRVRRQIARIKTIMNEQRSASA